MLLEKIVEAGLLTAFKSSLDEHLKCLDQVLDVGINMEGSPMIGLDVSGCFHVLCFGFLRLLTGFPFLPSFE